MRISLWAGSNASECPSQSCTGKKIFSQSFIKMQRTNRPVIKSVVDLNMVMKYCAHYIKYYHHRYCNYGLSYPTHCLWSSPSAALSCAWELSPHCLSVVSLWSSPSSLNSSLWFISLSRAWFLSGVIVVPPVSDFLLSFYSRPSCVLLAEGEHTLSGTASARRGGANKCALAADWLSNGGRAEHEILVLWLADGSAVSWLRVWGFIAQV